MWPGFCSVKQRCAESNVFPIFLHSVLWSPLPSLSHLPCLRLEKHIETPRPFCPNNFQLSNCHWNLFVIQATISKGRVNNCPTVLNVKVCTFQDFSSDAAEGHIPHKIVNCKTQSDAMFAMTDTATRPGKHTKSC